MSSSSGAAPPAPVCCGTWPLVQAEAIELTGGYFVATPENDPAWGDVWAKGAVDTKVPFEEVRVADV